MVVAMMMNANASVEAASQAPLEVATSETQVDLPPAVTRATRRLGTDRFEVGVADGELAFRYALVGDPRTSRCSGRRRSPGLA
jgi:hypothetical protein